MRRDGSPLPWPSSWPLGFVPDGRRVYVSLRDANQMAVIDTVTREVTGRIDVGRSPIQVHGTPDGHFVYVANQGTDDEPDDAVSVHLDHFLCYGAAGQLLSSPKNLRE